MPYADCKNTVNSTLARLTTAEVTISGGVNRKSIETSGKPVIPKGISSRQKGADLQWHTFTAPRPPWMCRQCCRQKGGHV